MTRLIYNGSGFVPGVPARDLEDDEVKQYGGEAALLNSGCFEREKPAPKPDYKSRKDDED